MEKYRSQLIVFSLVASFLVLFYFAGQSIIPFLIAGLFAFLCNPYVQKIQGFISNRNLAVTIFLFFVLVFSVGTAWFVGDRVMNDVKRLNSAFVTFFNDNRDEIETKEGQVKEYLEKIYSKKDMVTSFSPETNLDSLDVNVETIKEAVANITSFMDSGEKENKSRKSYNWLFVLLYTAGYFLYLMYDYRYFESRFDKYFPSKAKDSAFLNRFIDDFNSTFSTYFRQRTKVVFLSSLIFIIAFSFIGVPGAIVFGVLAGLLCYIPHFHYLSIIPLALSCWVLSIEESHSFYLYFGLLVGVCLLVSIAEELLFLPYIMKGVSTMNPAIMMLSFSVWAAAFGTLGVLIALPLTTLIIVFTKRVLADLNDTSQDF